MDCSRIHAVALITPALDKKDRCQQLLLDIVTKAEKTEPDTLQYQFFWVESSSEFLFLESYRNEDAFREHASKEYIRELQELAVTERLLAKPLDVKVFGELVGGFTRSV
ncbi:hypothetical protein BDW60DRAFT_200827 [Aspergillus nidulans var. acristatus]